MLVFDAKSAAVEKEPPAAIEDALRHTLSLLATAGFECIVRVNRPGSVFIFVKASDAVLSVASYQSQYVNYLYSLDNYRRLAAYFAL